MPSEISTGGSVPCHGILSALKILRYWGSYLSVDAPHADSLESGERTSEQPPRFSESHFKQRISRNGRITG